MSYEVTVARDGIEAMDKIRQVTPDLILLDIMMPEMDGFELGAVDFITKPVNIMQVMDIVKMIF